MLFSWAKTRTKKISNSFTRTKTITKKVQKNEKSIKTIKVAAKQFWTKTKRKNRKPNENAAFNMVYLNVKQTMLLTCHYVHCQQCNTLLYDWWTVAAYLLYNGSGWSWNAAARLVVECQRNQIASVRLAQPDTILDGRLWNTDFVKYEGPVPWMESETLWSADSLVVNTGRREE